MLANVLIDSGNLFGDLISAQLAKLLHLPILGRPQVTGTAAAKGTVKILGRTKPVSMYFEGIREPVKIEPYVVEDLAQHVNLGQSFLRRYEADLSFRNEGVQLRLKSCAATLARSSTEVTRNSIDERINRVLNRMKEQGGNVHVNEKGLLDARINAVPGALCAPTKKVLICDDIGTNVCTSQSFRLPAKSSMVLSVQASNNLNPELPENSVLLVPQRDNHYLNKKEVFFHPGCYYRVGNQVKVMVSNYSKLEVRIPANFSVGTIHEGVEFGVTGVFTLDHRPEKELSKEEIQERKEFVRQHLKLDANPLLRQRTELRDKLLTVLLKYWDALAISDTDYGRTNMMKFHIQLLPGARPVHHKLRPLNPIQEKDLHRQITDWTEAEVIEPSMSEWASALVACSKKNTEKFRWAVDYRKVNEMTVKDRFPLGSIDTNLNKLSGSTVFSCLDSAGAFHTLEVSHESRDYTSFLTPWGQYRFVRLPFGLANAPSQYSRLVQMALDRLPGEFALGYIDDVIVHSANLEEHLNHLEQVIAIHAQFGMKLNPAKCHVFQSEVEYLGHLVSAAGIRMIPSYVERIVEWPLPATPKELRSFLGFAGYYRMFIKEYSFLTAEMDQMKGKKELTWTEEAKDKFQQLKDCFTKQPTRGYPRYDDESVFILDTDFSAVNKAAVLSQKQDGREVFLGCAARKCNKAESTYPSHKGEMAALVMGLHKFEHMLRAKPFIVRTDSQCVKQLYSMKEYRGIWARWYNFVASFDFTLVHRKGKLQTNADSLSRLRDVPESASPEPMSTEDPLLGVEDIYAIEEELRYEGWSEEQLRAAQEEDITLKIIRKAVKEGCKPEGDLRKELMQEGMAYAGIFECLSLNEKNLLCYQAPQVNDAEQPVRLCVPTAIQETAFNAVHAHPTMGHFGVNGTFQKARERFYWPSMYRDIYTRVRNCVPCIKKRTKHGKTQHTLYRERLSYFGQRVFTDTVGPLTARKYRGKIVRHFVSIQDGFTRYLKLYPVTDLEAATVARAIVETWVYQHGCPEYIHSDRGTAYTAKLFQEVMSVLGICKTVTPPYSPEGDRVERAHRVIGNILRSDEQYDQGSWADKLPVAEFAYNVSVNRHLGVSPFEAVYGRPARLPVDLMFSLPPQADSTWSDYVKHLKQRFTSMFEQVCRAQETSLAIDQGRVQNRSKPSINEGDVVYYFLNRVQPGITAKLQTRWIGPFKVTRVVSDSLVVIFPTGNWAQQPREIAAIVSRIHKVDPEFTRTLVGSEPIDMNEIEEDTETSEIVQYAPDTEGVESRRALTEAVGVPEGIGSPVVMPPAQDGEVSGDSVKGTPQPGESEGREDSMPTLPIADESDVSGEELLSHPSPVPSKESMEVGPPTVVSTDNTRLHRSGRMTSTDPPLSTAERKRQMARSVLFPDKQVPTSQQGPL